MAEPCPYCDNSGWRSHPLRQTSWVWCDCAAGQAKRDAYHTRRAAHPRRKRRTTKREAQP